MAARLFTPEEANALLPQVRALAERMVAGRRAFVAAERRHAGLLAQIAGNGGDLTRSDLAEAVEAVQETAAALASSVDALTELGVQVKDLDRGLVDFPAERQGQPVLLCWQLGEDEVAWWHRPDEGFAGRQPL